MYKVLLIDDENPVHLAIRSLIDWPRFRAHEPYSAYNGQEGLKCMERLRPDIAFVDMNMPLMGGVDFLAAASRSHPNCQYIVLSGYDEFQYAQAAIRFSVVDYLLKPIDRGELENALKKAIGRLPERDPKAEDLTPAEVILSVRDYIDRHYQSDLRIEDLAEKFYFSKEYLTRLFHNQFGCAIYEYVLKKRMDKAKEYLRSPQMQIQEIAEALGYSNAHYFAKAFKHRYGETPSEFRSREEG
jgi:two-component system, response regulator YesN